MRVAKNYQHLRWGDLGNGLYIIDSKLSGEQENIHLGGRVIRAINTPGHSPDSMVYEFESDGFKVLFAQDVHGPLDPSFLSDREDYLRSLKLLLSLEVDILCEGHFGVYKGKKDKDEKIKKGKMSKPT